MIINSIRLQGTYNANIDQYKAILDKTWCLVSNYRRQAAQLLKHCIDPIRLFYTILLNKVLVLGRLLFITMREMIREEGG